MRELQCFFLKESFLSQKLGVGVAVSWQGRQGTCHSEFDLLSQIAFKCHDIRHSIFGQSSFCVHSSNILCMLNRDLESRSEGISCLKTFIRFRRSFTTWTAKANL